MTFNYHHATCVSTLRRAGKQHLSNLKNELSNLPKSWITAHLHSLVALFSPHLWNQLPHPLQSHSFLQVFKTSVHQRETAFGKHLWISTSEAQQTGGNSTCCPVIIFLKRRLLHLTQLNLSHKIISAAS